MEGWGGLKLAEKSLWMTSISMEPFHRFARFRTWPETMIHYNSTKYESDPKSRSTHIVGTTDALHNTHIQWQSPQTDFRLFRPVTMLFSQPGLRKCKIHNSNRTFAICSVNVISRKEEAEENIWNRCMHTCTTHAWLCAIMNIYGEWKKKQKKELVYFAFHF